MKIFWIVTVLIAGLIVLEFSGCSASKEHLSAEASRIWREQGFETVAYEGYQWGPWFGGSYGGATVWHRLRKIPDNGITYSGSIRRWGDEYMVYGPHALDAIKPH